MTAVAASPPPAAAPVEVTAPAPAAAQPPWKTVRLLPLALPAGTGRIAAAAAAIAAAALTARVLGVPGIGWAEAAALTSSAILLLAAIALGLRARAILVLACVVGVLATPVVGTGLLSGEIPWRVLLLLPTLTIASFLVIMWGVPDARSLGSGLAIGLLGALVSTAWPVLAVVGAYGVVRDASPLTLVCTLGVAPLAWGAASAGRSFTLRVGVAFAGLRDAAFRVVTLVSSLAAALWAGSAVERLVTAGTFDMALESLAPAAGWAAATAALALLVWSTWRLPEWLSAAQLRGRIDASAVGEPLVFLMLACFAALVAWRIDGTDAPGRGSWIAFAAGGAYAWCRLRYAAPISTADSPLWIVVTSEDLDQVGDVASDVASAWDAGQVTILAVPAAAARIGGEHLHAADRAGRSLALFPERPVHLEDWDAAQPASWRALPVRELYAPAELWPQILRERLDLSARVLVLVREYTPAVPLEASKPGERVASRFARRLLAAALRGETAPAVVGLFVPRSNAPQLRPGLSVAEVSRLAIEVVTGGKALAARLRALEPDVAPVVVRHILVTCAPADIALADRVALLLHGERDGAGRIVESWVGLSDAPASSLQRVARMPMGTWRHAGLLFARLLESAEPAGGVRRFVIALALLVLGRNWSGEFELVIVENESGARQTGLPDRLVEQGVLRGIVARMIAVRSPRGLRALTYPPSHYAGEIRLRPAALDVVASDVASKLLALDLSPITTAPVPEPIRRAAGRTDVGGPAREEPRSTRAEPERAEPVQRLARPRAADGLPWLLPRYAQEAIDTFVLTRFSVRPGVEVARRFVLVIEGGDDSAVREVPEYAATLAREHGIAHVQVDLEPDMWPTAEELVRELALHLDLDAASMPLENVPTTSARARRLATWVLSSLARRGDRSVILVRGSESDDAPAETLEFIGVLVREVSSHGGPLKIILDECRDATQWVTGHQDLRVAPIAHDDLMACIRQVFEDRRLAFDAKRAEQAAELTEQFADMVKGAVVGRRHRGAELRHALSRAIPMVFNEADE